MNRYLYQNLDQTVDAQAMSLIQWSYFRRQNNNVAYYFHYTSREIVFKIMSDRKLKPTWSRVTQFGHGVFLTELDPCTSDDELLENNYRGNYKYNERIQYAIAIPKHQIRAIQILDNYNRNIYRCDYEIDLDSVDFRLISRD